MTIAMDGPAGAGKSTVAKLVAEKLHIHYVDTGAMYRAIAYGVLHNSASMDEAAIHETVKTMKITVQYIENVQHVYVDGVDVSDRIRTPEVSSAASQLAVYAVVREKLLDLQREIAREWDVVMDGRDIGTVVLPNADLKIYITADASERARRRALEMEQKGEKNIDLVWMENEIRQRDARDMNRAISPLRQAEDAVLVDTTHMTIDEVVNTICQLAKEV